MQPRIEALLSARLFLSPQLNGERIFFISNLGGHLSLYAMDFGGSVPEPLLPPNIALQNPDLVGGYSFAVFPKLGKILVMIDRDGDENYQPMLIPIDGGFPEPAFEDFFSDYRAHLAEKDTEKNIIYISAESRKEGMQEAFQGNLETNVLVKIGASAYGAYPVAANRDHTQVILSDGYTMGDNILYAWNQGGDPRQMLYGVPIEERSEGQTIAPNGIFSAVYSPSERGLVIGSALFQDTFSLGYLDLEKPQEITPVTVSGEVSIGAGEMDKLQYLVEDNYLVGYNIDGVSWIYSGVFDEKNLEMKLQHVLVGKAPVANGKLEAIYYDQPGNRFILSFSTATSPTQIYTLAGKDDRDICLHTCERILGVPEALLSPGEDASFVSFDGTRVSARLYLPSPALGFEGPRPLVYYVHGGPQGQERPDFAWFSMPLIQFLTLNGFAVFVPNVRGSTGYGLNYTKQVDRDWGGKDREDHVYAMEQVLPKDPRLDTQRAGVVGRSYGGYMTLTLAGRHPNLWKAAVDMFGPYNLLTFLDRIPPTWKPYFEIALGNPDKDRDFLVERSPNTYMHQLACPMLVIQGAHDPRVVEVESRDLVESLRSQGKEVDYLMFENEGHDVLKYENRVTCYNAITGFFTKHLRP